MKFRALVSIFVLSLVAFPLAAQSNEVGLWASWVRLDSTGIVNFDFDEVSFDDTVGVTVSFDRYWTPAISTEFAVSSWSSDASISNGFLTVDDIGSLDIMTYTATGRYHFARESFVSPYLGAGVAFADADEFEFEDAESGEEFSEPVDSEVTFVANAGLNFNFSPSFGAAIDAKYMPYEATAGADEDQLDLEINPLLISAGVRFRF